jgi:2-oxoglutarate ferredoxin oxidoreductase subunit beta
MVTVSDYAGLEPAWCPGCGNFGILKALNKALVQLEIEPRKVLLVSGIGQAGKLPHYSRGNVFNSLHGRPVPPAIGAKIANPELVVIVVSGDGDAYGEGGNHFIHAIRRNHDITYLVHNNQVYGLTKGTPYGASPPINPITLAIAAGATFVARGFAGDVDHLAELIKSGIQHRGFALIDILQPCVSFNHKNTYSWYQERVYKLVEDYDPSGRPGAWEKAQEWGDRIPIGVIYRVTRPTFEEQIPALSQGPLVSQKLEPAKAERLLDEFR